MEFGEIIDVGDVIEVSEFPIPSSPFPLYPIPYKSKLVDMASLSSAGTKKTNPPASMRAARVIARSLILFPFMKIISPFFDTGPESPCRRIS